MSKYDREKQIQISETTFNDLIAFFLGIGLDTEERRDAIRRAIEKKINRMVEHDLYTQYKIAPTEEQKEQARQEYLERRGIPAAYRW